MSPRTQACLNVVVAMPNSCDAAASVQYLLAFFTCSYPAFHDSKMDPVRTIIAFDFRTARTVRRGRIQDVSCVFSLSRLTRLCAHQMVRQFKKKHPRKSARLFSSASADAAGASKRDSERGPFDLREFLSPRHRVGLANCAPAR